MKSFCSRPACITDEMLMEKLFNNSKKIYVVVGETGEYSDRTEWPVIAYPTEKQAQDHAEKAEQWYMENDCFNKRYDKEFKNPYDPSMYIDYTGTHWYVEEVLYYDNNE